MGEEHTETLPGGEKATVRREQEKYHKIPVIISLQESKC